MRQIILVMAATLVLLLGAATAGASDASPVDERGYANADSLISAEELKDIKDQDSVKVVDIRSLTGFASGHIPGAVRIASGDLADGSAHVNHMALDADKTAEVLADNGISSDDTIVVYCDNGLWSSRAWWLFSMYGHDDVRLLDGGVDRWEEIGYDTRTFGGRTSSAEYSFTGTARPELLATRDDVLAAVDNDTVVLDVRGRGEFTGEDVLSGAGEGGRVPGAVWVEWTEVFNDDGTIKTAAELEALYADAGITASDKVIPYCQGGIRSAHTTFVLSELLGFDVANYDGSWLDWSNAGDVPIETGS